MLSCKRSARSAPPTDFDCSEHGLGFKLSSMRLADSALVLSKFKQSDQLGISYLSVGLLSKSVSSQHEQKSIVSLTVVYQVKNSESFVPLTPYPEDVMSLILS